MNITGIKLTHFLSHVDTELDLRECHPYLFIGENGAGKSSLVKDAITFTLFGESRASGAGDDLIYNEEKSLRTEIRFNVKEAEYRVVRKRERSKKTDISLYLFQDNRWIEKTNVTNTLTQIDIENIVGFNYNTFAVSACLEQNSRLNFSELTPKQCKDIVMKILEIDKYNDYEKVVRDRIRNLEIELRAPEERIELNGLKIKKYENIENELKKLQEEKSRLAETIQGQEIEIVVQKVRVEKYITELEKSIQEAEGKTEELRVTYKVKETELNKAIQDISISGSEILRLQQRIKKMKEIGSKCPTCESEIADEHVQSILTDIVKELDAQQKSREQASTIHTIVQKEITTIEEEGKSLKLVENTRELRIQQAKLSDLSNTKPLEALKASLQGVELDIVRREQEANNKNELTTEIENDFKKIEKIKYEIINNTILQEAFGKNGIPAMVISNITTELEINTNALLRELTNKNLSVRFITEKNLKVSKELSDTLEIKIKNNFIERPYQLYSGGEKYRIDLAIRLAISQILARRNNFKLETLIIDEPSGLDRKGLTDFKDVLQKLSSTFKKILVVSHLTELIDDNGSTFKAIEVKSNNGVSFVKD